MKRNQIWSLAILLGLTAGCGTMPSKKIVLDESGSKPSWVDNSKTTWEQSGKVYFKAAQQVRGNERLSACYDLAKLNGKESLISEIQEDVKGVLDSHEATLSENAEIVLNKSRSSELTGKINGLRFSENYFVRYSIADNERIDCYYLGEISQADYNKVKRSIIDKVVSADPRIKEQITKKHIQFFSDDKGVGRNAATADSAE